MDIYRMSGYEMDDLFKKDLGVLLGGMKRTVTQSRIDSGTVLDKGKKPMSLDVYKKLCLILYSGDDPEYVFAHLFLILEWILMARSDNCLQMTLTHLQWRNDSLVFFFGKTKRNQTGDANHHPWHVYSNPFEPEICPVLALAKYFMCHPQLLQKPKCQLFPGGNQYSRFSSVLHKVLNKHADEFAALGVDPKSLGTHSIRKGAISLVSAGCTVSPPMAAICLWAAWTKDWYIHYE